MRKARQVTERGIRKGSTPQPPTPVAKIQAPDSATKSDSTPSQEAPARKKLKLSVRKPSSNDGDTIAVSRPKRASTIPRRYSEDVFVSDNDKEVNVAPSPTDSSELSSMDTPPKPENDDPAERKRNSKMAEYGSFMDYYVLDDGKADEEEDPLIIDDDPEPGLLESKPATPELEEHSSKAPIAKTEQPVEKRSRKQQQTKKPANHAVKPPAPQIDLASSSTPLRNPLAGNPVHYAPNQVPHPSYLSPSSLPQQHHMQQQHRPIPPPPPIPQPDPPVLEEITVKYHAPIVDMVANVWALCTALANVGGVAPAKPPPDPTPRQPNKDDKVGGFLSLFDDDSDSKSEPEAEKTSQEYLERQGEPDSPLTYGIQFIMNALKSWAQTRLYQQQVASFQAIHNHAHHNAGTPGSSSLPSPALQPPVFNIDLENTPEGKAISAFRKVVESGCLQLNVRMPQQLSNAVCHLYMQIDKLINQQGNRGQAEYQPMSYSAQIAANRVRVAKWKEQEAQMFFQHQQMMQQMAVHPQQAGQWQVPHPQDHLAHRNGRRRSKSHRQHRSSQGLPASAGPSPSPMNAGQGGPFAAPRSQTGTPVQGQLPPSFADGNPHNGASLTKMQIYTASLPMSGQKMKFSFMPENQQAYEEALKAFGPEAFPKGFQPGACMPIEHITNHERPPSAGGHPAKPRLSRGSVHAAEGHGHPVAPSGFTPVNQAIPNGPSASPVVDTNNSDGRHDSIDRRRSLRESTTQTPAPVTSATPDIAARYPHPGAVVIDE